MKFPVFEFLIDDTPESGIKYISIVPDPAFQSKAMLFSKVKPQFIEMADSKKKKRKICGLALIPNVLIYRKDDVTGDPYYGFFSVQTIEKIVEKFHDEMNNNNLNLNHNQNQNVDAVLIEDYIVDSQARVEDLKSKGIEHENIMNSWYVCYRIKNEETFNSIMENQKAGNGTGFSIECYLDRVLIQMHTQINDKKIKAEMKKNNKSLLEKIVNLFKNEIFERALVPELGFEIEWGQVGEPVQQVTVDEKGVETLTPLVAGEYKTDVGIIVVDDSSNLAEVRDLPPEPEPTPEPELPPDIPEIQLPPEEPITGATGNTENATQIKAEEDLKDYPWDQCVSDQKAKGLSDDSANKICGYIKSKNMSSEDLTEDMLKEILGADYVAPASQLDKTILEIVGANDGDYMIKVKVEGGLVTKAEVSSETDLLKTKLSEVEKENKELKDKMKEPINDPVLEAPIEKKDWNKMSAYEKTLYNARQK